MSTRSYMENGSPTSCRTTDSKYKHLAKTHFQGEIQNQMPGPGALFAGEGLTEHGRNSRVDGAEGEPVDNNREIGFGVEILCYERWSRLETFTINFGNSRTPQVLRLQRPYLRSMLRSWPYEDKKW